MLRNILVLLLAFCSIIPVSAQADSSHLRISLLTCSPGDEAIWEVFGHTAIRVIDSVEHTDLVYNYGTFEYGPNFEMQFMRGKLLYCLSVDEFSGFLPEYILAKRSVEEQVLLLDGTQKEKFYSFLNKNALPEHKYYKYDFFFDNCATRIRDIFPKISGTGFVFGQTIPKDSRLSFRDIINKYFYRDHWTRLGVNILLGSKIDRVMTNEDIMFLPDYLRDGVGGATVNGHKIAANSVLILPGDKPQPAGVNWALILTSLVALLTIIGLSFGRFRLLGRAMSFLLLFVTGLLGCLIIVMWFGTDHQGCADNFNILWCLPTNIVIAFFNPKGKSRYALTAIFLIFVSLLLHIFRIQGLTILELTPLFLALLCVYGSIYKSNKIKPAISEVATSVSSQIFYAKMGSGPVLILLHGFPESGSLWRNVRDELSASYMLIIPDFPGSGNSILEKETSISQMADCVKNIMDKEGIDKAVIAGHSMGGYVAFAFATSYPENVAGLSLVHSTPEADDDEKKQTRLKIIEIIRKGGKTAFISQMVPNLF